MSESLATHVEYAKSNRSECVKCHRPIPKDAIRIGRQFHAHHEGQRYYHLKCWTPKDTTKKPVDYIFGFEHLQPKDQIAVNKHCGFSNEGAIASDHHVAGALATAAPSTTPATLSREPAFSSNANPFATAASSTTSVHVAQQKLQQFGQPQTYGFASVGATTNVNAVNVGVLSTTTSLDAALKSTSLTAQQVNALLGPMIGKSDAKAVLEGAFELFLFNRDIPEFMHTLSRVVRVV